MDHPRGKHRKDREEVGRRSYHKFFYLVKYIKLVNLGKL